MQPVTEFVLSIAGSPWIYPLLAVLIVVDAFFPPIPSEILLVSLAALAGSGSGPSLRILLLVAAVAAACGATVTFIAGQRVGMDRWHWMRTERVAAAFSRARQNLDRRPAVLLLTARFVPVGRVAVTFSAGALRFPLRRFLPLTVIAGAVWALYTVGIGWIAGSRLSHNPLLSVVVGVGLSLVIGLGIDLVRKWVRRRR